MIIPALNEEGRIGRLLDQLAHSGVLEAIVVDGGSTDRTAEVVGAYPGAVFLAAQKGRASQLNAGANAARGDVLFFAHADSTLPQDAIAYIRDAMGATRVVGGSFSLAFDHDSRWMRWYADLSKINHIMFTYGDQGLFVWRKVFDKIGGYADLPIMEDVEIQRRLRKAGRFVKLRPPIITSARRFAKNGIIWQQAKNAMLVTLYWIGIPPKWLSGFYQYP